MKKRFLEGVRYLGRDRCLKDSPRVSWIAKNIITEQ